MMPRSAKASILPAKTSSTISPTILQPDVFSTVLHFCDNRALSQLSLVCRSLDHQVIPTLYRRVTIDFHRGKIAVPRIITDDRYPFASVQKENDRAEITPRFATALRYTRILLIRGHLRERCQARYFTHGLPTQMIEALVNVHTVRLVTIPQPHLITTIAGLCDVGGPEVCHLVHLLRNRYTIYSRPPNGFGVIKNCRTSTSELTPVYDYSPPISAIADIPGKEQILIHPSYPSKGDWVKHNLPLLVFHAPLTVIVQLPTEEPAISNLPDYAKSIILGGYISATSYYVRVRFACGKEMMEHLQEAKADFARTHPLTSRPTFVSRTHCQSKRAEKYRKTSRLSVGMRS